MRPCPYIALVEYDLGSRENRFWAWRNTFEFLLVEFIVHIFRLVHVIARALFKLNQILEVCDLSDFAFPVISFDPVRKWFNLTILNHLSDLSRRKSPDSGRLDDDSKDDLRSRDRVTDHMMNLSDILSVNLKMSTS